MSKNDFGGNGSTAWGTAANSHPSNSVFSEANEGLRFELRVSQRIRSCLRKPRAMMSGRANRAPSS